MSAPMESALEWTRDLVREVDAELRRVFARESSRTVHLAGPTTQLVSAIESVTMRGGKRLRPMLVAAAAEAVGAPVSREALARMGASLELLQTYLLIHDDWMDGDSTRRGGPTAHVLLRGDGGARLGDSLAILAGDLASVLSWSGFLEVAEGVSPAVRAALLAAFIEMQREVVLGQELDVRGDADVTRMHQLKTGSYTVGGPLRLGALLAGATADQLRTLECYARPLGEAFQVRDDLLNAYGAPAKTGKPAGSDLPAGKHGVLVRLARERGGEAAEALHRVLGLADADAATVSEVLRTLERLGVRAQAEAHLAELASHAVASLDRGGLAPSGVDKLRGIARAIASRES